MQARKKTTVRYSKIIVPCSKCGHGCEVSLGYSGEDETSGSSSESDAEVKPPAKRAKLAVEPDSVSDSDSDAPAATTVPQKPAPINSRVSSSSSSSDSDSPSEAPVLQTAVAGVQKPVTILRASSPSSESSDSAPKPVALNPRPTSSSSDSSDSDSSSESGSSDSDGPKFPNPLERSSVQQFFSQFPSFQYDSSQPVMTEYSRMSQTKGFKSLSLAARRKARRDLKDALSKARRDLKDALAKDFGRLYGYDVDNLDAWQSLCRVLRFENIPDNLEGCQKLVAATYVNIIDLIDTVSTGDLVHHFNSEKELSGYTRDTGNYLSKDSKHAGSLLKFLLRKIRSGREMHDLLALLKLPCLHSR
ncbi:hypothetical protein RSAG8_11217, partial [Rhizoctonia solani AG-8 WAC10335]